MTTQPVPNVKAEPLHLFDSSPLPAEAFVYNAAAEMIRSGAPTASLSLTRRMYRRIAGEKSLRSLLANLRREFDESAPRLTVGTERLIGPQGEFEYYINFALNEP